MPTELYVNDPGGDPFLEHRPQTLKKGEHLLVSQLPGSAAQLVGGCLLESWLKDRRVKGGRGGLLLHLRLRVTPQSVTEDGPYDNSLGLLPEAKFRPGLSDSLSVLSSESPSLIETWVLSH